MNYLTSRAVLQLCYLGINRDTQIISLSPFVCLIKSKEFLNFAKKKQQVKKDKSVWVMASMQVCCLATLASCKCKFTCLAFAFVC